MQTLLLICQRFPLFSSEYETESDSEEEKIQDKAEINERIATKDEPSENIKEEQKSDDCPAVKEDVVNNSRTKIKSANDQQTTFQEEILPNTINFPESTSINNPSEEV